MVDTSSKPSSEERDEKESSKADGAATDKPASTAPVVDPMRAYRACLHCRSRKTKCNLDANGGRPVCCFLYFVFIKMGICNLFVERRN